MGAKRKHPRINCATKPVLLVPNDPWRMAARPPSDLQQKSLHPCLEPSQYTLAGGGKSLLNRE